MDLVLRYRHADPTALDVIRGIGKRYTSYLMSMPSGAEFALAVLAAVASREQEPQVIPAFPTQAEAITADVVVLDKQGRPVRGLTKEDFTLFEDGRPQTIVGFQARELAPPGQPGCESCGRRCPVSPSLCRPGYRPRSCNSGVSHRYHVHTSYTP